VVEMVVEIVVEMLVGFGGEVNGSRGETRVKIVVNPDLYLYPLIKRGGYLAAVIKKGKMGSALKEKTRSALKRKKALTTLTGEKKAQEEVGEVQAERAQERGGKMLTTPTPTPRPEASARSLGSVTLTLISRHGFDDD